jgi:hypothetical protein
VKLLVLATVFLCVCNSSDASVLSVRSFLATAQHDPLLQHANEKVDFLQSTSSNTPFIDRAELRTRTDDFELTRQRYSIRLYPNGLGETDAGRKVYETSLQRSRVQRELQFHQALKKRYLLVLDLLHSVSILELNRQAKAIYQDRVTVLEKSRSSLDFDINDLIGAYDDLTETELEIIELEASKQSLEDSIGSYMPTKGEILFSTENLVNVAVIRNMAQQIIDRPAPDNVYIKESLLRVDCAKSSHALEEAQSQNHLRYFEISYDNGERHDSSKAYFLELGIRFPFINSNRLDINRRKLQLLTAQASDKELKRTLEEGLATCSGDIKRLIKGYAVLTEIKQQATTDSLLKDYRQVEGISPLVLLKMKESILKRNIALDKIHNELLIGYIELLDITGKLSEKPLKNYISADLEFITPCE